MHGIIKCQHQGQMSESFPTVAFLSISGGLQDAYTYVFRGKVFANAQTGNIVLLSQNICERNWLQSAHYFVPLAAFAIQKDLWDIEKQIKNIGHQVGEDISVMKSPHNKDSQ